MMILPTITTTWGSNWRVKIKEINEIGLKEIALFPTCLPKEKRKELYRLLEDSNIKSIPLVHIRSDMAEDELDYFVRNYGTKAFNTHMQIEYPLRYDLSKYKDIIYIENVYHSLDEEELKKFGGICLDLSHLENDRLLHKEIFEHNIKMTEKYPLGSNHISAVKEISHIDEKGYQCYDNHRLDNLSELNYLKKYSRNYFSSLIAIELENNIKEQLQIKKYLTNLLKGQKNNKLI